MDTSNSDSYNRSLGDTTITTGETVTYGELIGTAVRSLLPPPFGLEVDLRHYAKSVVIPMLVSVGLCVVLYTMLWVAAVMPYSRVTVTRVSQGVVLVCSSFTGELIGDVRGRIKKPGSCTVVSVHHEKKVLETSLVSDRIPFLVKTARVENVQDYH